MAMQLSGSLNILGKLDITRNTPIPAAWSVGGDLNLGMGKHLTTGAGTQNAAFASGGVATFLLTEEYNGSSWSAGSNLINQNYRFAGAGTRNAGLVFGGAFSSTCTEHYTGNSTRTTFNYSNTTGKTMIIPPTTDPGVVGALWNNNGTLSISAG